MAIISSWILRIIIFIIVATIIDALLPENKMKQYVYLVFGFILFLIFTQPLLYLFSIDINKEINKVESIINKSENELNHTSTTYELQKDEIELEQRAYILKQAKNTLMNEANSVLEEDHQVAIIDLQLIFKEQDFNEEEINQYDVTITDIKGEDNSKVEPIIISTKKDTPKEKKIKQTSLIKETISQVWEVQKEIINVNWEENKH